MVKQVETPVLLAAQTGDKQQGVFVWQCYEAKDRWRRALSAALLGFALLMGLYLVPLVHLPLLALPHVFIPAFALLGVVVGAWRFRILRAAQAIHGTCPSCTTKIQLDLDAGERVPLHKYCPRCDKPMDIIESSV